MQQAKVTFTVHFFHEKHVKHIIDSNSQHNVCTIMISISLHRDNTTILAHMHITNESFDQIYILCRQYQTTRHKTAIKLCSMSVKILTVCDHGQTPQVHQPAGESQTLHTYTSQHSLI